MATFPSVTPLPDGSLLASYRVGTSKDSDDETVELRRSTDGGRTWDDPVQPFSTDIGSRRGSLKLVYLTSLGAGRLVAAAMWVDREAYPGKPLFNEETEGCLPMKILLAESANAGQAWTPWRLVPIPEEIGPPSLTNPLMVLPSGRWALSIETNKTYLDSSQWNQRVVYLYSENQGRSWSQPVTVSQDPTARIFYWDQRAGVTGDGVVATFSWTYDRQTNSYLNIHRRLSRDEGRSWTPPEDLGITDQAAHPAILPDGQVLLSWVDRFKTQAIKARLAERVDAPFGEDSEVVLYQRPVSRRSDRHQRYGRDAGGHECLELRLALC